LAYTGERRVAIQNVPDVAPPEEVWLVLLIGPSLVKGTLFSDFLRALEGENQTQLDDNAPISFHFGRPEVEVYEW
jgi:hypothetical protein